MEKGTKKLGFGLMRLPQLSAEPTDIDYEQLNQMVDLYLEAGFDYFDTSYAYHNGESETAIRKCLVNRYPRERFRLASKLPTFIITEESQVEEIFEQQLARCGVYFFDYYLLHNVNGIRYQQGIQRLRRLHGQSAMRRGWMACLRYCLECLRWIRSGTMFLL